MSMNAGHAAVLDGAFDLSNRQYGRISADFAVVCLWSLLGLSLTALVIAFGFGAEIAEILPIAG